MLTILWSLGIWNWKGENVRYASASWADCKSKSCRFQVSYSFILCNNNEPFLDQVVMCNEKWILHMITGDDQLSFWTEKLQRASKSQIHTKDKVMITVWWSAARLIHYSFLSLCETTISEKYAQQVDEIDWEPQCLQLASVNRKGPILPHNTPNRMLHN